MTLTHTLTSTTTRRTNDSLAALRARALARTLLCDWSAEYARRRGLSTTAVQAEAVIRQAELDRLFAKN